MRPGNLAGGSALTPAAIAILIALLLKAVFLFADVPTLIGGAGGATYQTSRFPDGYDRIATSLISGHGYRFDPETAPTLFRTPGFVFVLAGLFIVFGKSLLAVQIFNLVVSSATAYLVFLLAVRIGASRAAGLVAALIYFLYPGTMLGDSRGGPETLFTFAIVAFLLLVYRAIARDRLRDYVLAGLVFGALLLVRSTGALFPGLLFLYLLARRPTWAGLRSGLSRVAALSATALLVLSPWIVRNYILVGEVIPTMTLQGAALFQGVHVVKHLSTGEEHHMLLQDAVRAQDVIAREMGYRYKPDYFPEFYTSKDEVSYYRHLGELGVQEYRRDPVLLVKAVAFNAYAFWFQGRGGKATALNFFVAGPMLILAAAGWVIGARRGRIYGPLLLFVAAFYVVHLPVCAVARYHIPLVPLLAIPAGLALKELWDRVGAGGKRGSRKLRG